MIRKIHLDFHTRPEVTGIGAGFDPEAFADLLAQAHVNALATPGKCNFGNTYFDATVGHPHPHLVRPDLFPATVQACARRGIRVQAYFNFGMDEYATSIHPDWSQRYRDGTCPQWGMPLVEFASPYIDEVVIPGVIEMIGRCPGLAGFWFDICLYINGAFYSSWFEALAQARLGAAADDEANRWQLGRTLIRECCQRLDAVVKERLPDAENYFNSLVVPGEPGNIPLQPIQEVENPILFGGPEKMTTDVRWLRAQGARTIGLVSRFQGPWMDPGTLRTADQMRFDVARSVALGCDVSMGDHRHPDGSLDPEVYRRIGRVYSELVQCEPWLDGAKPCREAVLLTEIERGSPHIFPMLPALTTQAARLLEESGIQFDIASVEDPLPEMPLVIWPGQKPGSPALLAALRRHLERGGSLLAMDAALCGLEDAMGAREEGAPEDAGRQDADAKTTGCGHVQGSFAGFFRLTPESGFGADWHGFAHLLTHPTRRLCAQAGVTVLAERLSLASVTPPCVGRETLGPAMVRKGRVIYSAASLFAEAMHAGSPFPAEIVAELCAALLGRPLVRHSAGTTVVAHLHRAAPGYALHLVHWAMDRWGKQVNSALRFPQLGPIAVELAIREPVREVTLLPTGKAIAFEQIDGVCRFTVPGLHVWQMVGVTK